MSLNRKEAMLSAERAINGDDPARLKQAIADLPDVLVARTPYAGATWLHYAAREGKLDCVEALLDAGADVNQPGYQEGETALCRAANGNKVAVARLLLRKGSTLNTSKPTRNPLFCAIVGRSPEIAKLFLYHGIDASVRYSGEMDATAFALLRGETEIAQIIATHIADGDRSKADVLLQEAEAIARRQGPLKPQRIIPTDEDLNKAGD